MMRTIVGLFTGIFLSVTLSYSLMASDSIEAITVDEETGFIIDEHWELAKTHCTACHSARLVIAQRGTKQTWLDMIRWMQNTQGLWKFDQETEENLLNYLAKNYAPAGSYRRMPIPPELMPAKP